MTTPIDTETEPASVDPDSTTNTTTDTDDTTDSNREAAGYRRQLREAEGERDKLRSSLETMQRSQVEDIAKREHGLAKPAGLWTSTALVDLLGDDGQVDPGKVKTAVATAVDTLGLRVELGGAHVPSEGRNVGPGAGSGDWSKFLKRSE